MSRCVQRENQQIYLIQARDEDGIDVSVLGDGLVEGLGVAECTLEYHRGCFRPDVVINTSVKETFILHHLHKVCWSITQSERGESLEWQRNWARAPYDERGGKREDFVLRQAIRDDLSVVGSVVLTKSKGVSNGLGNGTCPIFERRYALWRASTVRIDPAAVKYSGLTIEAAAPRYL